MPTYQIDYHYLDVSQWVQAALLAVWNIRQNVTYPDDTFGLRAVGGKLSVHIQQYREGDDEEIDSYSDDFINRDGFYQVPAMPRQAFRNPGWNTFRYKGWSSNSDDEGESYWINVWKNACVEWKKTLIIAAFGSSVDGPYYSDLVSAHNQARCSVAVMFVHHSPEIFVLVDKLLTEHTTDQDDYNTVTYPGPDTSFMTGAPPAIDSSVISRIATATEEIALSRIEISANNGDAMFSVMGGTRAGPIPPEEP